MPDLVAHIREVIDLHAIRNRDADGKFSCGCGATHLSDHSSHLAQAIINRLALRRDAVADKVRYISAFFDEELTVLEGAE